MRGEEWCPRTLVDRKRKRYESAVDVVERLHDPTDPSTESTALLPLEHCVGFPLKRKG